MTTPVYVDRLRNVDSSVIYKVGYDNTLGVLYVQFLGGTISSYKASEDTYDKMSNAWSVGAYYNKNIKGLQNWAAPVYDASLRLRHSVSAYAAPESLPTNKYEVTVEVKATLVFTVEAEGYDKAVSLALAEVDKTLKDGSSEVTNVKKV